MNQQQRECSQEYRALRHRSWELLAKLQQNIEAQGSALVILALVGERDATAKRMHEIRTHFQRQGYSYDEQAETWRKDENKEQ